MPFRERVRRALGRGNSSSTGSDSGSFLSKTDSRKNSSIYQPGEKMPPMKYRRPVDKAHKEKLESFSFANAWRRKSFQSQYSPMGSRMPSRRNSIVTMGRKSFQASRKPSALGVGDGGETTVLFAAAIKVSTPTSLSRQTSHENKPPVARGSGERRPSSGPGPSHLNQTLTNGTSRSGGFTQEELSLALKRSHLDVPVAVR